MTSLYICYQSLLEPLTQTQVIAYLDGLALAGFRIVLLTFEPRVLSEEETQSWQKRLAAKGITWHCLRYHKSPTVPATSWDVLLGIVTGLRLIRKYDVRLVHARAHIPGLMALALKRLAGVKFLFDIRGFMAEEYVDGGIWPHGGVLFRMTKRVERALVEAADAIVVLTRKAEDLLRLWYPRSAKKKVIEVIPCCVDLRPLLAAPSSRLGEGQRRDANPTLLYAGKLGGWYLTEAMVDFIATAMNFLPGLRWNVWTQSDPTPLRRLLSTRCLDEKVSIGRVAPEDLPGKLSKGWAALSFIKPCVSKLASSPTKIGEYLAAGLPIVSTAGIGDLDTLLNGQANESGKPIGVLLRDCTEDAYRQALPELIELLNDPSTPQRCRAVAGEHFDLARVGWPRYRAIYGKFLEAECKRT
jgi:glycosyltransferase involved in cell wall biosynthesis